MTWCRCVGTLFHCSGVGVLEGASLPGEAGSSASNQPEGPTLQRCHRHPHQGQDKPTLPAPTGLALLSALPDLDLAGGTSEAETRVWGRAGHCLEDVEELQRVSDASGNREQQQHRLPVL